MYAHLLLEECKGKDGLRDDLAMIAQQADRCKKIVAGLLDFARQNKLARNPTDVRELIDQAMGGLPAPDRVRVQIEHGIKNSTAELDRDQIIQVITNLVTNAYAAMSDGGTLTIRTGDDNGRLCISISDTGTGIPKDNLKKIFEPFFTTKQIGKGTGLGLAVTYGIVKMHRGDIRVESNNDPSAGPTGTTFTVTLPRQDDH